MAIVTGSDSSEGEAQDAALQPGPAGRDHAAGAAGHTGAHGTDPNGPSVVPSAGASGQYEDLRGKCKINSGFPGDETCIPPPPPEEGMQIHVGPSNYQDPAEIAKFVLHPGEESSECWTFKTPNDKPIKYQTSVLSGRSGTHHIINTMHSGELPQGSFTVCADNARSIGTLPGASKPYMPRGTVAPEYANVGRSIPAHATVQADMHYYNYTDKDLLREFWLNIYYAKEEEVTVAADQIAGLGGLGWNAAPIAPGTDKVYSYSCPIKGNGHILSLLGHYHAHGKRFSASIKRKNAAPEKVFEMYDYLTPASFEYNSVVRNPGFSDVAPGAVSGILPVSDGDVLQWECHIVNDSTVGLRYVNEVKTGEMCNLWGVSVGIQPLRCYLP